MKKIIVSIFWILIFVWVNSSAQHLNRDMKMENLKESTKINPESEKAYILVKSEVPNLRFDSNRRIDKVNQLNSGEWEVWLPAGTHILKIFADGFMSVEIPATNFGRKKSYEMIIKAVGFAGSYNADEELIEIVFDCSEDSVYSAYGEFAPTLTVSNLIAYKLPKGDYSFRFSKKGFEDIKRDIKVSEPQNVKLTFIKGKSSQQKLNLPGIFVITSKPDGAELIINGQKIGVTPFQGEIIPGKHRVELRKNLYYSEIFDISIEQGKTQSIDQKLKPRFGYLTVNSDVIGSEVFLDEKSIGRTPINEYELESSKHKIKISQLLYYDYSEEFIINDGDSKAINAVLKPNFGTLAVNSMPEQGAIVYLDGKQVGTTPYKNEKIQSGKYLLKVTKDLFSISEEQIIIQDGKILDKNVVLNKNFGELEIIANEARIYINDEIKGRHRFSTKLEPGKYTIKTEISDKYYTKIEDVYITRGEKKQVDLTPDPKMGGISVFVEPSDASDASLYINDEFKGNAPLVLPLMIGNYQLTAKKMNYLDESKLINIIENNNEKLVLHMLTFEGSRAQTASKWGTVKWISLGATLLSGGAAAYFHFSAESNYDKYKNAQTSLDAINFKAKVNSLTKLKETALYAATSTLSAAIIAWIIQAAL